MIVPEHSPSASLSGTKRTGDGDLTTFCMNSRIEAISALGAGQTSVSEETCWDSNIDGEGDEMRAFEVRGDEPFSDFGVEERDRFLGGISSSFTTFGFFALGFGDCADTGITVSFESLELVFLVILQSSKSVDLVDFEEAAFAITFAEALGDFETVAYKRLYVNRHKNDRKSMRTAARN